MGANTVGLSWKVFVKMSTTFINRLLHSRKIWQKQRSSNFHFSLVFIIVIWLHRIRLHWSTVPWASESSMECWSHRGQSSSDTNLWMNCIPHWAHLVC